MKKILEKIFENDEKFMKDFITICIIMISIIVLLTASLWIV